MRSIVLVFAVVAACKGHKTDSGAGSAETEDRGKPVETADIDRPAATGSTCAADTDCVISCDTKADCCSDPGCAKAVMASAAADVLSYRSAHCTDAQTAKCPDIPAPKFTVRAACKQGACVAIKHGASEQLAPAPGSGE
jgi:hypothetical protein